MSPLDLPYITLIFQTIQGHGLELQRSWSFALLQLYALIITKRSWSFAYHRNISTPIHQDNVSRDGMLSKIEPPCWGTPTRHYSPGIPNHSTQSCWETLPLELRDTLSQWHPKDQGSGSKLASPLTTSLLCWNCRELKGAPTVRSLKLFHKKFKHHWVYLFEIKSNESRCKRVAQKLQF